MPLKTYGIIIFTAIGQVQRVLHCTLTLNASPTDEDMETEKYISEYKTAIEEEKRITMVYLCYHTHIFISNL